MTNQGHLEHLEHLERQMLELKHKILVGAGDDGYIVSMVRICEGSLILLDSLKYLETVMLRHHDCQRFHVEDVKHSETMKCLDCGKVYERP
jgi:hypothetical protein